MNIKNIDALILRSFPFSETSQILHLFSSEGKSAVMAKGANRPKSKFSGKLQPLFRVNAIVHHKESRELDILQDIEIIEAHLKIIDDFDKSVIGNAVLETIHQLFYEGQPVNEEYEVATTILNDLEFADGHYIEYLVLFLHRLIVFSGFNLSLDQCRNCGKEGVAGPLFFDMTSGNYLCSDCLKLSGRKANMDHKRFWILRGLSQKKYEKRNFNREESEKLLNFHLAYIRTHWKSDFSLKSLELLNE